MIFLGPTLPSYSIRSDPDGVLKVVGGAGTAIVSESRHFYGCDLVAVGWYSAQ